MLPAHFWAKPRMGGTTAPPAIAITISAVISFAFSGNLSSAIPMHITKVFAEATDATNTQERKATGPEQTKKAATARTTAR